MTHGVLAHGGLAVLVVAALGVVLGAPLAAAAREGLAGTACDVATGVSILIGTVALATPMGAALDAGIHPWVVATAAAAIWAVARSSAATGVVLAAALLSLIGLATPVTGRWTLVDPLWSDVGAWWPGAVAVGALFAAPSATAWRDTPLEPTRAPWAVAGFGLVTATLTALALSTLLGTPGAGMVGLAAGTAVVFGAAHGTSRWPALAGAVLTILLLGPGRPALPLLWHAGVPASLALLAGLVAWERRGVARWGLLTSASGLALLAIAGWPGLPDTVGAAVIVAAIPVLGAWTVGTAAVRRAA